MRSLILPRWESRASKGQPPALTLGKDSLQLRELTGDAAALTNPGTPTAIELCRAGVLGH